MSNYILKYTRDDRVKYISHLDFMRLFHRAVRRAGLPFVFSQGFNPHPVMTVAMPLSVGMTSGGEYMKVGFDGTFMPEQIMEPLNQALPPGFAVIGVVKAEGKEPDLTKIDRAWYTVEIELEELVEISIEEFLAQPELKVMKRTKSGTKESDIRPYIYELYEEKRAGKVLTFRMKLACGNTYNLKPETVAQGMEKYIPGFQISFVSVHRECLLAGERAYL